MGLLNLVNGKTAVFVIISFIFVYIGYIKYTNLKQEKTIFTLQADKNILQNDLNSLTLEIKQQALQHTQLLDELDRLSLENKQHEQQKQQLAARLADQIKQFERIKEVDTNAHNWSTSPVSGAVVQLLKSASGQDGDTH